MSEDVSNFLTKPEIVNMKREVMGFLEHVQLFYVKATAQIKQRFPIDDSIIKSLGFLNPDTLHSTKVADVLQIASEFLNVVSIEDLRKLDDEWCELRFIDRSDLPEYSGHRVDVGTFLGKCREHSRWFRWSQISNCWKVNKIIAFHTTLQC